VTDLVMLTEGVRNEHVYGKRYLSGNKSFLNKGLL
jgi:hypothetical protein